MAVMLDVLSWICLIGGSLTLVSAAIVIWRMRTFYTRLHAASVNETLGPGLILLGLALQSIDHFDIILKLALILVFLVLTGPVASHALAKAALDNGLLPGETRQQRKKGGPASPI